MESVLGEGGYATIYKARCMESGNLYAVKHLRLTADAEAIKEVQNEAKTMTKLQGHPNVLQLLAVAFAGTPSHYGLGMVKHLSNGQGCL